MKVIDACVHHDWPSQQELMPYMSPGWRTYLEQPAHIPGPLEFIPVLPQFPYHRPDGDKLGGKASGSSYEQVRDQLLDAHDIDRAILTHDLTMFTPATANPHLAGEVARAANDWTLDRWLSKDERLHALILVPNQTPDAAAAEIERIGDRAQMAGVLMAANGLSKPFGHPAYHAIYAAAAERGLPVVVHAGGDAIPETLSHTTGGGLPSTYGEYAALRAQSLMTHIASLVVQGVFVKFPTLRVLVIGGGVAWLPALCWRLDNEWIAYRRESPWVVQAPSEYIRSHVRLCTYPLDVPPRADRLARLLRTFDGIEDLLVFGSGYPNWDTDWPEDVLDRLPEVWRSKVFQSNASELFRWEPGSRPPALPASGASCTADR